MTVTEAIRDTASRLAAAAIDDARLDARRLVAAAAGLTPERMLLEPDHALDAGQVARLAAYVQRRLAREPLTRILGERYFYGRRFEVTPDTLDPRPDTETLIELALTIAHDEGWQERPLDILDFGTGTGCILLTLLSELPMASGLGVDLSPTALAVAHRNADALGLAERTRWLEAGTLDRVPGTFDLVVSNPPYIPSGDISGLEPEVRQHDPVLALDGGLDGLDVVREIVAASARPSPRLGTWFMLEVGAGQWTSVVELISRHCGNATAVAARTAVDLGGHTRCVAWKPQT